jgi:hypothetical protein
LTELQRFRTPSAIEPGMHIRWMNKEWHVDRVYNHHRFGRFFACTCEDDGTYELINVNGNDGPIEVLEAA